METLASATAMGPPGPLMPRLRRPTTEHGSPTLLVDHWYSHAVGHVVEALRRCQGYHACDPTLRISLVLNGASPVELARCAPFVREVFGVPFTSFGHRAGNPSRALRTVPRDWDYVVHHPSSVDPGEARFEGMARFYDAARRHFRARAAVGLAGQAPPAYEPHQQLRLVLPDEERTRVRAELQGRRSIVVMPAGSGARLLYPSVTAWELVLRALEGRFPDAAIGLVGRVGSEGGRTTSGISRGEVDALLGGRRAPLDLFDRPLLSQLAAVEAASLFVSPHTGFGFAAVAVGTPWLTIAGGDWHEYFFNGVPFYSVLPKSREQLVFAQGRELPKLTTDEDGEGPRALVMRIGRIRENLEELVTAAALLVEERLSYPEALARYVPRLLDAYNGDWSQLYAFDGLDLATVYGSGP